MRSERINWLKRRYGYSIVPAILVNGLLIWSILYKILVFGRAGLNEIDHNFLLIVLFFNIIPFFVLSDIWAYKLGWSEQYIFATPLVRRGSYQKMPIDDIDVVDIKARSDLISSRNAKFNPAVIVLYRRGWDGDEIFALDPRRTNLRQFKELVSMIHNRRPATFTESALRYFNGPDLMTPREDANGQLAW